MPTVHIFISSKRFSSFEEMRSFIDPTYTADGEKIDSDFMREVKLAGYEPMCIEAIYEDKPISLSELLNGASYWEQWLPEIYCKENADSAICVFEPNIVKNPNGCSLHYVGAYSYKP